jgi:hypothetical protein
VRTVTHSAPVTDWAYSASLIRSAPGMRTDRAFSLPADRWND